MKKILSVLTAALLLSSSAACQSETTTPSIAEKEESAISSFSSSEVSVTSEEPEETSNLALGEKINLDDWEITVNSYGIDDSIKSSEYTGFKSDEGSKYVSVNMTVKNLGVKANTFVDYISFTNETIECKIYYQNKYEYTSTNLLGYDLDLHNKQLNPLESFTGVMAYSVVDEAAISSELTFHISFGKDTYIYRLENPVATELSFEATDTSELAPVSQAESDRLTEKGYVLLEEMEAKYNANFTFLSNCYVLMPETGGIGIWFRSLSDEMLDSLDDWEINTDDARMKKENGLIYIHESDIIQIFGE